MTTGPVHHGPGCDCKDCSEFVNASQLKTWFDCERKWGFENLVPPPERKAPTGAAINLGNRTHAIAERFFTRGPGFLAVEETDAEAAKVFTAAVAHIPASPRHHYHTEDRLYTGIFRGTADMWYEHDGQGGEPVLYDWKTTGNFNYALTEATLPTDPQAMIYAQATGALDLNWIYMGTKGLVGQCNPVRVRLSPGHSKKVLDGLIPTANLILTKRAQYPKGLDRQAGIEHINNTLAATDTACGKYGGCPHKAYCRAENPFTRSRSMSYEKPSKPILPPPPSVPVLAPASVSGSVSDAGSETKADAIKAAVIEGRLPFSALIDDVDAAYAQIQEPAPKTAAPDTVTAPPPRKVQVLCLNCAPVGVEFDVTYVGLLEQAKSLVNEEFKVADYRFVDYGKGAGALAQAFRKVFDALPSDPPGLSVDASLPESSIVLSFLMSRAVVVIR